MTQNDPHDGTATTGSDGAGRSTTSSIALIAWAALIVSLTAPYWEDAVLGSINLRTPAARHVDETTLALDKLERRQAELEKQLNATTAQVAKLTAQVSQDGPKADTTMGWARTLALVELGAALRNPGSFDLELATVRTTISGSEDLKLLLAKIEPYAATGVPGMARLRQDFATISSRIEWSERSSMPMAWVRVLVSWRGEVSQATAAPASPSALQLLSDATAKMRGDDLAGAIAIIEQIGEPTRTAFAEWTEDATARIAADSVTRRINEMVQAPGGTTTKPATKP